MNLADRFNYMIDHLDITKRAFAESLNISESYIGNITNDRRNNISVRLALSIEDIHGFNHRWILNEEHPIRINPDRESLNKELMNAISKMSEDEVKAMIVFLRQIDGLSDLLKKYNL